MEVSLDIASVQTLNFLLIFIHLIASLIIFRKEELRLRETF